MTERLSATRKYISLPEATKYSGIKRTRLYEIISTGDIIARKMGRRTLVDVESVERYIDSLPEWKPGKRGNLDA